MSLHPLHPPLTTLATTSYLISFGLTTHSLLARPSILSIYDRYPSPLSPYAPLLGLYFLPQQLLQGLWLHRLWKSGGSTRSWLQGLRPQSMPLATEEEDDEEDATLVGDDEEDRAIEESRFYTNGKPEVYRPLAPVSVRTALPSSEVHLPAYTNDRNMLKKRTALSTAYYLPAYTLSNLFFVFTIISFRKSNFVLVLLSVTAFTLVNAVFVVVRLGNLGVHMKHRDEKYWKSESRSLELLLHWVVKGNVGLGLMLLLEAIGVLYFHHPSAHILLAKNLLAATFITIAAFSDTVLGAITLFSAFALAMGQTGNWGAELSVFALFLCGIVGIRAMAVALIESHVSDTDDAMLPVRGRYGALDFDQSTGGNSTGGIAATAKTDILANKAGTPEGGDPMGVGVSYASQELHLDSSQPCEEKSERYVNVGFGGSDGKIVGKMPDGPARE